MPRTYKRRTAARLTKLVAQAQRGMYPNGDGLYRSISKKTGVPSYMIATREMAWVRCGPSSSQRRGRRSMRRTS